MEYITIERKDDKNVTARVPESQREKIEKSKIWKVSPEPKKDGDK